MKIFQWTCWFAFWFLDHPLSYVLNKIPPAISADPENNSILFCHVQTYTGKATWGGAQGHCSLPKQYPMGGNCVISTRTEPNAHQVQKEAGKVTRNHRLPLCSFPEFKAHTHTLCVTLQLLFDKHPQKPSCWPSLKSLCQTHSYQSDNSWQESVWFGWKGSILRRKKKKIGFRGPPKKCKGWTPSESTTWPPVSTPTKKACKCYALWAVFFFPPALKTEWI